MSRWQNHQLMFTSVGESFEPAVEVPAKEARPSSADDVDFIIQQVIEALALMGPAEENQEVDASADRDQPAATTEERHWFDLPYEDLMARFDVERQVVTASDTDEDIEQVDVFTDEEIEAERPPFGTDVGNVQLQSVDEDQQVQFSVEEPSADEAMSLEDIMLSITLDISLPSAGIFKKLATINIEDLSRKEEQVLICGETEITHVARSRKRYILLKYREVLVRKFLESWKNNFVPGKGSSAVDLKVIDMLSDLHLFVLEELREQALEHGLKWTRTCCSKIVEGSPRDRGSIIARTNTNTLSTCWLRTMIRVDGVWVVEPFCNQWVKIPRPVVCTEVSKQCSFVDFFPAVSEPLKILRKRWADICLEIVGFCASRRLLPVGSLNFSSSDESMNFEDTPASISLPADPSPDISKALNQLRASIDEIGKQDDGAKHRDTLLLHLHDFEKQVITRLDAHDRVLGALRRDSNDQRTLLSLELQSSHKQLGTQIVTTGLDVVDVRRVVRESHQELNARINSLDEQVAATRHDLLEFSAQAQQTLNIITSQLSELVAYINRVGYNKKGESSSSRHPLPTPVHQSEGTGDAVRITEPTQEDIDNANRAILERMRKDDRERERRERSRGSRSG
ncbi:hypothetical protein F511_35088 [Dorcoceras hygrometricum]|uniref:Uncharacterized protein n=1 Tax=Dorcoceras hygrometricum TaxID=472368 RepID=A0A2Z7B055_9LAMI|nr:hypothetical protein F511_35088 [Dorcoceras hygrometricum]